MQTKLVWIALVTVVAFLTVTGSNAHALLSREFGGKVGWVDGKVMGDSVDSVEVDGRSGISAGLFARQNIIPFLAVQLEGVYIQKGAKQKGGDGEFKFDYLEFPLLGVGKFPLGPVQLQAHAGIALAFNLSAKSNEGDVKDDVKSTDWSGIFGLGAELPLVVTRITGEVRWTWGLRTLDATADPEDIKSKTFQVLIGATLPF